MRITRVKVRVFILKFAQSGHRVFFYERNAKLGTDLTYGSVPVAPRTDKHFFLVFSCIWLEIIAKITKCQGLN